MVILKPFKADDIEILSPIMKEAFNLDSQMHLNENDGPDGYDNGDFLRKWFCHKKATPFTILLDDKIIGGVNLRLNDKTNINFLGCIFIDPKYENKGVGLEVWKIVESKFPNTICWKTETPIFSRRNHHFYINKCGFACVKIVNPKNERDGSFILEKKMFVKQ